jgi:hypothetical protein
VIAVILPRMQGISYRAVGLVLVLVTVRAGRARGELPAPPTGLAEFPFSFAPDAPGAVSAEGLLDKPAGRAGRWWRRGVIFIRGRSGFDSGG